MMQCKDIADVPILRLLADLPPYPGGQARIWGNWIFDDEADVRRVMPAGVPDKLVLAKMRQLIRRGVVDGCPCGCRGDFEITEKGLAELADAGREADAPRQVAGD
jgi:hypothetical protein